MLEYKLDNLEWEKFEQLVQSLLKFKLGLGIEAWGGHGDWGRDAYFDGKLSYPTHDTLEGGFVFQCKFTESANAAGAKPEIPILNAVRKESSRIRDNLSTAGRWSKPPICYAFFTNAPLTPKLRKSIGQLLTNVLPKSKICIHDGYDICQWLRLSPDIARSFDLLNDIGQEIQTVGEAVKELGETVNSTPKKEIRAKLRLAQTLARQEKGSDGIRELEAALALAQAAKLAEEEVEILLALGLFSSTRRGIGNRRGYLDQVERAGPRN